VTVWWVLDPYVWAWLTYYFIAFVTHKQFALKMAFMFFFLGMTLWRQSSLFTLLFAVVEKNPTSSTTTAATIASENNTID
jgi:hypothetical protein